MSGVELFIVSLIVIELITLLGVSLTIRLGKQFWPEWLERHIMAPDPNPEPVWDGKGYRNPSLYTSTGKQRRMNDV